MSTSYAIGGGGLNNPFSQSHVTWAAPPNQNILTIPCTALEPTNPQLGQMYFDTVANEIRLFVGHWVVLEVHQHPRVPAPPPTLTEEELKATLARLLCLIKDLEP